MQERWGVISDWARGLTGKNNLILSPSARAFRFLAVSKNGRRPPSLLPCCSSNNNTSPPALRHSLPQYRFTLSAILASSRSARSTFPRPSINKGASATRLIPPSRPSTQQHPILTMTQLIHSLIAIHWLIHSLLDHPIRITRSPDRPVSIPQHELRPLPRCAR